MNRILFVDDDANLLDGYKRNLRNFFVIETSLSGKEGLKSIIENGPFSVVISDLRMPEMGGIEFLSTVKDSTPDTARIMLTGYADLDISIDAVNKGNIFRFLTKPCPPELLKSTIEAGIRQYELVTAERELLEKTLKGVIKILTEIISLANPSAFSRTGRIIQLVRRISNEMGIKKTWHYEIAAMLSQIGCIAIPEDILNKAYHGELLLPDEEKIFSSYPRLGYDLISNIPRMSEIARIIHYQTKNYDGTGFPDEELKGEEIPLGSRLLKIALDFDTLISSGMPPEDAIEEISRAGKNYDPSLVTALKNTMEEQSKQKIFSLTIKDLKPNMVLAEDVLTIKGSVLLTKGQQISQYIKLRMENYDKNVGIKQPIKVFFIAE